MSSSSAPKGSSVQSTAPVPASTASSNTTPSRKNRNKKKKNTNNNNNNTNNGGKGSNGNNNSSSVAAQKQQREPPPGEKDGVESARSQEPETLNAPGSPLSPPPDKLEHTFPLADEALESVKPEDEPEKTVEPEEEPEPEQLEEEPPANGHADTNGYQHKPTEKTTTPPQPPSNTKLEATMSSSPDNSALQEEVEKLRQQLEAQSTEITQLKADLEESESAKDHAETQYQTLLGRVEKIKETLGERLKRDKAELEEAKDRVEELEAQNDQLTQQIESQREETEQLKQEVQEQGRELASLRSRSNLSQQNWHREKDDLDRLVKKLREELESTATAMGEWEVIAMEERSQRELLAEKVSELEEELLSTKEGYERAVGDRDVQSQAVDRLQRALQEIQDARKKELRDIVEANEELVQFLKKRVQEAEQKANEAEAARETLSKELERTASFEKEVKEKNLLIGKLRHEAIVLNDHLTKALKYIKKTKPEEMIDKQLVTNHFLQFLTLDRSDPKRFQILQVMAGFLGWSEEQREKAGLSRPGASGGLRLPTSPFHRTPSSPALNSEFFADQNASLAGATPKERGESLSDLWASFLERSVDEAGVGGGGKGSRKDSASSAGTRPGV
ncbi:hypothetical protein QC763_307130 [Podospora pseudopauciseta]|uniref:GRIP domain-containing protein n=1 Tax=Podospora pseudopauciseta TaxID=2093780 RepID=A0ABR0HGM6_9PEZI|nr:hypothetical protein QC763_307130 [Podospora pseudopauciseta]